MQGQQTEGLDPAAGSEAMQVTADCRGEATDLASARCGDGVAEEQWRAAGRNVRGPSCNRYTRPS